MDFRDFEVKGLGFRMIFSLQGLRVLPDFEGCWGYIGSI